MTQPEPPRQASAGHTSIAALRDVVADVGSGRGRIVVLSGAAGIGKTRLLAELRSLAAGHVTWLEGHCPLIRRPRRLALHGDPLRLAGGRVRGTGNRRQDEGQGTPRSAPRRPTRRGARHRSVPCSGSDPSPRSSEPTRFRGAYLRWLEALAAEQPVVVVLEDVQWADVPTQELAEAVMELTDRAGIGAGSYRRADRHSRRAPHCASARGSAYGHRTTEISLGPLGEEAAEELLAGLLRRRRRTERPRQARPRGGGQPALSRGARAGVSGRGARDPRPHVDDLDAVSRAAAADAGEPPARADRQSRGRSPPARADSRRHRSHVPGRSPHARHG